VRYVAGGTDALMAPCFGRRVCAAIELALTAPSMDAPMPDWADWVPYFDAMAGVLLPHGGRPHPAKFWSLLVQQHAQDDAHFGLPVAEFAATCARFDPARQLRSEAFDALFGLGVVAAAKPT
jgi:hypothetical protein